MRKNNLLIAEQKRKIEAQLAKAESGGLTPQTIQALQEALNLF